jgi:hypothetical protein
MCDGLKFALVKICSKKCELSGEETLAEPYIPFIPDNWNRCLVLAEAQNHSNNNKDNYVEALQGLDPELRMRRLYLESNRLRCQPWDDGSLKFALACISTDEPERLGVCNAVLWSRLSPTGSNQTPSESMQKNSVKIWTQYLDVLKPTWIVCAGKVARNVIEQTGYKVKRLDLLLPSPLNLQRLSTLFDTSDLLKRYLEVDRKLAKFEDLIEGKGRNNKILFACHAVSMALKHKVGIYE